MMMTDSILARAAANGGAPSPRVLGITIQHRPLGYWVEAVAEWFEKQHDDSLLMAFRLAQARNPNGVKVQDWDRTLWVAVADELCRICRSDVNFITSRILFRGLHSNRLFDTAGMARMIATDAGYRAMDTVLCANLMVYNEEDQDGREETVRVPATPGTPEEAGQEAAPVGADSGTTPEGNAPRVLDVSCPNNDPQDVAPAVPEPPDGERTGFFPPDVDKAISDAVKGLGARAGEARGRALSAATAEDSGGPAPDGGPPGCTTFPERAPAVDGGAVRGGGDDTPVGSPVERGGPFQSGQSDLVPPETHSPKKGAMGGARKSRNKKATPKASSKGKD